MPVTEEMLRIVVTLICGTLLLPSLSIAYNVDTKSRVIYNSSRGNYFGYTVALNKNKFGPVVLVGAPKADTTTIHDTFCDSCQVHQPGVLFRCNVPKNTIDEVTCSEVILYTTGNTVTNSGNRDFSYHDKKDNMWLGVSLDVQQGATENDIVVCGHLWKNQLFPRNYLTNGLCYIINSNLDTKSVKKLVPLIQISKQSLPGSIFYYAYGQAGTSVSYSEDGKTLILGAPGMYDGLGGLVSYAADSKLTRTLYKDPIILRASADETYYEAYVGYSVTSGRFFDNSDMYYAVGAPRDNDNHGRVNIFKTFEKNQEELFIHQKKEGTQFGEYFGASVLGININGDDFTDLLVGAPFHSLESGGDEGKVYIYISNGMGLQSSSELMGSSKVNARFGTSIANVGDLNQDGFNDFAVGAPYEDGKGAVYIYHGSKKEISSHTQKIEAREVSLSLSGFGIHISRGLDIDNNHYPDILVGSYASSNAVLFRTRPIVQIYPQLNFNPKQINMNFAECEFEGNNLTCINVTACLRYSGKHVPLSLSLENDIYVVDLSQINLNSLRGFFVYNGSQVQMMNYTTELNFETETCTTHLLYINSPIKDIITPIQILLHYRLSPPLSDDGFDKSFPVIDTSTQTNITSAVSFMTGCGQEEKCFSDLVVSAVLRHNAGKGKLILGEVSSVSLDITVKNKGEPAFLSELFIYLPPDISSTNQDSCFSTSLRHNASLFCDLSSPLMNSTDEKVLIILDISKIQSSRKKLEIVVEVVTASTDTTLADNIVTIPLNVQAAADIGVTGIFSHEQIIYDAAKDLETFIISHTYIIRNYGPSHLEVLDIKINVPTAFIKSQNRMEFLTLIILDSDSGKQMTITAQCNDTYLNLKSVLPNLKDVGQTSRKDEYLELLNETRTILMQQNDTDYLNQKPAEYKVDSSGGNYFRRSKRSSEKKIVSSPPDLEDVVINCESENVECVTIQCFASPFKDLRKFAQITISAEVNMTTLSKYLGSWHRVELVTDSVISMRDTSIQRRKEHPALAKVTTVFVWKGLPAPKEMEPWIIFVSIGVGVLLLIIILILLIRFGFFRRKQKEKMEQMIVDESKEYDFKDVQEEGSSALTDLQEEEHMYCSS